MPNLSPRQQEYLRLFVEGLSEKEIAFRMGISPKTVHSHRAAMKRRLGAKSHIDVCLYAIRAGLIKT